MGFFKVSTKRYTKNVLATATLLVSVIFNYSFAQEVLNIYNWPEYIAPDTVKNFEKKYNVKVNYNEFESNEILHSKMVARKTGYDIVVPGSQFGKMQIDGGLLLPIDKNKIPNYKNLDPAIMKKLAELDSGNKYLVPWLWGYNTVGINTELVKKALGDMPIPDNSWDLLFNPEYASKLKSCGLTIFDSPSEVFVVALHYLGKKIDKATPEDFQSAYQMLKKVRPYFRKFGGSGLIDEFASGKLCAIMGYSGDIGIANSRAIELKKKFKIEVLIPSIGGTLFIDTMAIPADAPNPNLAHLWINYILEPAVHASLTDKVFYATPNLEAVKLVNEAMRKNPAIFLTAENMAKMPLPVVWDNETRKLSTKLFTDFKRGK